MSKRNRKTLLKREIDMIIDSDVSLQGWGAHCGMQTTTTRGAWSQREAVLLINSLELLTVTSAVRSILLRINNTTAVVYVKHLGVKRESQPDKELVDVG